MITTRTNKEDCIIACKNHFIVLILYQEILNEEIVKSNVDFHQILQTGVKQALQFTDYVYILYRSLSFLLLVYQHSITMVNNCLDTLFYCENVPWINWFTQLYKKGREDWIHSIYIQVSIFLEPCIYKLQINVSVFHCKGNIWQMFAKILNASLRICYTGDTIDKHLYAREQWLLINEKYNILKT